MTAGDEHELGLEGGTSPTARRISWRLVVVATPAGDAIQVEVSSAPAPTPPGLGLADAIGRLEAAIRPFEELEVTVLGLEHLVEDPQTWAALARLPTCVSRVEALGQVFDLRDAAGAGLWRLALRLVERVGDAAEG